MPGTVSGSVDHVISTSNSGSNQEFFTNLYRFLNGPLRSSSYTELVALHHGMTSSGAPFPGTNYHDEGRPFGELSWAVFRFRSGSLPQGGPNSGPSTRRAHDFYLFMQWAYNQGFNTAPGSPGLIYGSAGTGIGFSVAWRDDGTNPWNGGTAANGSDAKGSPVWTAGSSVLHVFPRSNNTGGTHATVKQNTAGTAGSLTAGDRWHFIADRDSLLMMGDAGGNNSYNSIVYIGTYEPLSASQFVTSSGGNAAMPMIMINDTTTFNFSPGTTYGDTGGTSQQNGGIVGPNTSSAEARNTRMDRYSTNLLGNSSLQPNPNFNPAAYDEFRIPVMLFESPAFGHTGYIDMIAEAFNIPVHSTNSDNSKASFGAGGGVVNVISPWSGSAPGSTSTRTGRQF